MPEKGRKKRITFVICVSIFCIGLVIALMSIFSKKPEDDNQKSFELAKLLLEYSSNVSLESKNVFTVKKMEQNEINEITVNLTLDSISSPTSGQIEIVAVEKDEEERTTIDFIIDSEENLFIKANNGKNLLKNVENVEPLRGLLNNNVTKILEKTDGDWILINDSSSNLFVGSLIEGNSDENVTCLEDLIDKYDQSTARYFTSTIDDEIERYVFYTSNDKIERLAGSLKECLPTKQAKNFVDSIVELIEDFSGLKMELDENNFLRTLTVNNETEDYDFSSETILWYSMETFYVDSPEEYLVIDDLQ